MQRHSIFNLARSAFVLAIAATLGAAAHAAPSARALSIDELRAMEGSDRFASGRVIVKFRSDATEADKEQAMRAIAPQSHKSLSPHASGAVGIMARGTRRGIDRYQLVNLSRLWSVPTAIAQLRRNPMVEDVQPDWMLKIQDVAPSNDASFNSLWAVHGVTTTPANPFGTGAAAMWQQGYSCMTTQPVYVAVLDTGVRTSHEDLKANIYTNAGDNSYDGIDNDGNGFVDDVKGWNFYANTNSTEDDHSHGTHVAGTIAARRNNGVGIAGMCGDGGARIIPMKVCSASGSCPSSAVMQALSYLVDLKTKRGVNVVAVNLSLGGLSGTPNANGIEYFQAARDANIMVSAAAGNNGVNTDGNFMWPANLDVENVIAVANMKQDGVLSSTSNYGVTSVDIAAPGTGIYSTVIGSDSAYQWKNGTSMAAPHVAGALALYRALNPLATVQQTRNALLSSAAVEPSLNGKVAGARRLDVSRWAWGKNTSFTTQCGNGSTRRTAFWLRTTAHTDATMGTTLQQMGVSLTAYNAQGAVLGTYNGKTDAYGQMLWTFGSVAPWGSQFSVTVRTDNGGNRTYQSSELRCTATL